MKNIEVGDYLKSYKTSHIYRVIKKVDKNKAYYYDIESITKKEKICKFSDLGSKLEFYEDVGPQKIMGIHHQDLLDQCSVISSKKAINIINKLFS